MSGTGHMHRMSWLLNTFAREVAGVAHVIVVSVDGLLLAASEDLPEDRAEQLAAITAGLVSLTYGVSRHFEGGEVHQTIVDMDQGSLITMAIGDGSSIAVLAARQTDVGQIGYEMALLVERVGKALAPGRRDAVTTGIER
jgi:predicted regulator of Ras-like GTPase activity (Roadblock/LC7/MglB family)